MSIYCAIRHGTEEDPRNFWWTGTLWSNNRGDAALYTQQMAPGVLVLLKKWCNVNIGHLEEREIWP